MEATVTLALLLLAAAPALQWSATIGEGYSPPAANDQLVCTLSRQATNEVVSCFQRTTGKLAWRDTYSAPFQKNSAALQMAPAPFSTPVIQGDTLFTLGGMAHLRAYSLATGKLKWQRTPAKPISTSKLFCGTAMTPLLDQGRLIVFWGDDYAGELIALDPATGRTLWSNTTEHPVYASLAIADIAGVRQYITLSEQNLFGVDAATGKTLWRIPFQDQWNENIITPVVTGNTVIVSGVRKPTTAYVILKASSGWITRQNWSQAELPMYISNPVLDGTTLYGLTSRGKGRLFALDSATGKQLWASEGRYANNVQLRVTGRTLYALTDTGELIVNDISSGRPIEKQRHEVAKTAVWAAPVITGRQLFIRDETTIRAFALP